MGKGSGKAAAMNDEEETKTALDSSSAASVSKRSQDKQFLASGQFDFRRRIRKLQRAP